MTTYDGESNSTTPGVKGGNTAALGVGVWGESSLFEAVHGIGHGQAAGVGGYNDNAKGGPALWGSSSAGEGVHGETSALGHAAVAGFNNASTPGNAPTPDFAWGVFGATQVGEGVHGQTNAPNHGAVVGWNGCTVTDVTNVGAWGVWGFSQTGEGVHGETTSMTYAAVAGIARNPKGNGAGVFGQSQGLGPAGFFAGDVMVTGTLKAQQDVVLLGADCAEEFDVAKPADIEPGTVMVIDETGVLVESRQAYDTRVAGVIAGAGDYKPGIVLDKRETSTGRLPVALVGKAFCKVEAEGAPIEIGDLLTTSFITGCAMKAQDPLRAFGAVIGKALRPLRTGRGLIPILIALQ
jgi:hypothetical protein